MSAFTVLVADDHAVVRGGIRHILSGAYPDALFLECIDSAEVLKKVHETPCNVIIMDISMPGGNGLEVLRELKSAQPTVPVIMLTMFKEDDYALRAFELGASGYLQKGAANEELITAVKTVCSGQRYVSPGFAEKLVSAVNGEAPSSKIALLSEREHSIFLLIAKGQSLKEIAWKLGVSPKTVTTYRTRILGKLDVDSNAAIVQFALKSGLIE